MINSMLCYSRSSCSQTAVMLLIIRTRNSIMLTVLRSLYSSDQMTWIYSCCSIQGLVYTNTDVEEVHLWMVKHFTEHPLFVRVPEDELVGFRIADLLRCPELLYFFSHTISASLIWPMDAFVCAISSHWYCILFFCFVFCHRSMTS